MTHWHVVIKGEPYREKGALATTYDAGVEEVRIENQGNPSRNAQLKTCDKPCFGSRKQHA